MSAVILETQGFEVALEADVAGLQVNLLATKGRGRGRTRILVECKAFSRLVGLRTARSFATTVQFLRETKHVEAGWLVALEGFTPRAREMAERFGIKVGTLSELRKAFSSDWTHEYLSLIGRSCREILDRSFDQLVLRAIQGSPL